MNSSRRGLAHGFKLESLGKVRQYLRLNCLLKPVLGLGSRMLLSNSMYQDDVMISDCTNSIKISSAPCRFLGRLLTTQIFITLSILSEGWAKVSKNETSFIIFLT